MRTIKLDLRGQLSVYDASNGCFYLGGLSDGSTVPFSARGIDVALRPVDGEAWNMWSLTPEQAQAVLRANGGDRSVVLAYTLAVLPDQSLYPAEGEIAVSVAGMAILGQDRVTRLSGAAP